MASETGIELLSCLRRTGSIRAFSEVPIEYFKDDDEVAAFTWLRDHVMQFRSFPGPALFQRQTGIQTVVTQQNLAYYIDKARRRLLYNTQLPLFGNMTEAMQQRDPDRALQTARQISALERQFAPQTSGYYTLAQAVDLAMNDYGASRMTSGMMRGLPSGWDYVDNQTGGWIPGELITYVGRPGLGKTYILLFNAYNAWLRGHKVMFLSNELACLQLVRRLIGIHTKINPDLIRKGRISSEMNSQLVDATQVLRNGVPFDIIIGGFKKTIEAVRAFAEEATPDGIYIDAGYAMRSEYKKNASRREIIADIVEGSKTMALELNVPVIQTTQLNRKATPKDKDGETRGDPLGHMSLEKIGESDTFGQASSYVIGIDKCEHPYTDTRRWMGFLKGREGESGRWIINYTFEPVDFSVIQSGYGRQAETVSTATTDIGMDHMLDNGDA